MRFDSALPFSEQAQTNLLSILTAVVVIKDFIISIQQDELYEAKPSLDLESAFIQLFNQITCQGRLTFFLHM